MSGPVTTGEAVGGCLAEEKQPSEGQGNPEEPGADTVLCVYCARCRGSWGKSTPVLLPAS